MRYIYFILFALCAITVNAQNMKVKSFTFEPHDIEATANPRFDNNEEACALVRVVMPMEGAQFDSDFIVGDVTYEMGEYKVWMAVGATELEVSIPDVGRRTVVFAKHAPGVQRLKSKMAYKLEMIPVEGRRTLVMAEGSYGSSTFAAGLMVAFVKKHGGYVHARYDFGSVSTDMSCDDNGTLVDGDYKGLTPFYKEGVKKKMHFSVTGGYMLRIIDQLYGYVGVGYGQHILAWQTEDAWNGINGGGGNQENFKELSGVYVKNADHSTSSVAAEIGAIGRFGKFAVSLGYQTIGFKYHDVSLGVGVFF